MEIVANEIGTVLLKTVGVQDEILELEWCYCLIWQKYSYIIQTRVMILYRKEDLDKFCNNPRPKEHDCGV